MRDCPKLGIVRLLATIVLVLVVVSGFVGEARGSSSMDWNFLQNSYWYVPTVNLPALLSSTAKRRYVHPDY